MGERAIESEAARQILNTYIRVGIEPLLGEVGTKLNPAAIADTLGNVTESDVFVALFADERVEKKAIGGNQWTFIVAQLPFQPQPFEIRSNRGDGHRHTPRHQPPDDPVYRWG